MDLEGLLASAGRYRTAAGRRVHLAQKGEGPPVVLLHGASGNLRDWASLWAHVPGRAVAVDRPGFGHSDGGPRDWSLAAQREGVRAGLRAAGIAPPYLLVGHSWSGALVLDWALAHPGEVAGIAVISGATMDWGGKLELYYKAVSAPLLGPALARAVPLVLRRRRIDAALAAIFAPDPVPEGYADWAGVALALRPRTFRLNALTLSRLHSQILANAPRYGGLAAPLEILHGTEDSVVPARIHAEPLARAIPGARLTLLEGSGHMPHHARPARVAEAIGRLIEAA